MSEEAQIRFDDGASYERLMGRWSRLAGVQFLDWLAAPAGARWVDVGCGNGAFTELLVERCAPASVHAFDPAPAQIEYARQRLAPGAPVRWAEGNAMALPLADASCDAATMALVLFFVPEPARGVAEMLRVVRPGGAVAAYHWDMLAGGFPLAPIGAEMKKLGHESVMPPSVQVSTLEATTALWQDAGLQDVQTCQITVQRTFENFDDYWDSAASSNTLRAMFAKLSAEERMTLKEMVRSRLNGSDAPLTVSARANAVKGLKPA